MQKNFGEWLSKRLHTLRNWHNLANTIAKILKNTIPDIEVYVFGSILEEDKITGSSDIDILVAIPENHDEAKTHLILSKTLEDKLGNTAHLIDLHVVHKNKLNKPPYKWWLKKHHKIT